MSENMMINYLTFLLVRNSSEVGLLSSPLSTASLNTRLVSSSGVFCEGAEGVFCKGAEVFCDCEGAGEGPSSVSSCLMVFEGEHTRVSSPPNLSIGSVVSPSGFCGTW